VNLQLISQVSALQLADVVSCETTRPLGAALLGEQLDSCLPEWPVQRIFAPLLGASAPVIHEIWLVDRPVISGNSEGIAWCRSGDLLYGVIELDEANFSSASSGSALQAASQEAYRRIFRLLDAEQLPYLWRVWNYLAAINQEAEGLERYRQFNIGRQDAFLEYQRGATGNVPAACAIGLPGGPLSIAFMAGALPAIAVENPRQVSAYDYPAEYGPRSPTFSRAALVYLPDQEVLFISGTASIVGHRTVHPGDVVGQCRETVANVAAVVDEANRLVQSSPYVLAELVYRVYVRHAADFHLIRDTLAGLIGAASEVVYLQADICRHDLLLEIEAMASHSLRNS
jgi:chorismate lyase / 3-hydroxybenzoate synthase